MTSSICHLKCVELPFEMYLLEIKCDFYSSFLKEFLSQEIREKTQFNISNRFVSTLLFFGFPEPLRLTFSTIFKLKCISADANFRRIFYESMQNDLRISSESIKFSPNFFSRKSADFIWAFNLFCINNNELSYYPKLWILRHVIDRVVFVVLCTKRWLVRGAHWR